MAKRKRRLYAAVSDGKRTISLPSPSIYPFYVFQKFIGKQLLHNIAIARGCGEIRTNL